MIHTLLVHMADAVTVDIDWGAFVRVLVVAFVAAVGVVTLYSLGLRLLAVGSPDDTGEEGHLERAPRGDRPLMATLGAWACIGLAAIAVLAGLYFVIPVFPHPGS